MTDAPRPTRGIQLGRIGSARIIVQPSTLLMLLVLAWLFASSADGSITRQAFSLGVLLAVLLFVSVFLHELAHALVAWAFKREVREIVITLWGGHTSFDARSITPLISGATALAGPVMNGLLALVSWLVISAGGFTGTPRIVVGWLVTANLLLAAFNALPGIPMDGGRVFEAVVWAATGNRTRGTIIAAWAGRVIAVAVLLGSVAWPLLRGRSPDLYSVLWGFIIFMVLWPAASAAIKVSQTIAKREAITAGGLMRRAVALPYTVNVAQAREAAASHGASEVVVLAADGAPAGHFPVAVTDAVPEAVREETGMQAVTVPVPRGAIVASDLDGSNLVDALRSWYGRADAWVVVDGDAIVGVLTLDDAIKALQ